MIPLCFKFFSSKYVNMISITDIDTLFVKRSNVSDLRPK